MGCIQKSHPLALNEEEKHNLETFFHYLFENTTAGYVLYGEKPLTLCHYPSLENSSIDTPEYQEALMLEKGIETWNKLPGKSNKYLIAVIRTDPQTPYSSFLVINKTAFSKAVKENLSLFQFKLGTQCNEETLLNRLLAPCGFSQLLKGHESLQGILFGYGVQNSLTYERGNALRKKAEDFHLAQGGLEATTPEELREQILNYIQAHNGDGQEILDELTDFSFFSPSPENAIAPKIPFSFHTSSEESATLINQYTLAEKELATLQSQNDFLDHVLKKVRESP